MGELIDLNSQIPENRISGAMTTDAELAAAIAAHLNATLMDHGQNLQPFNANNWNPQNIPGRHKTAANAIYVTSFDPSTFAAISLTNFPPGTVTGMLVQIEIPGSWKTQFFLNSLGAYSPFTQIFWRSGDESAGWTDWGQLPSSNIENIFSQVQRFPVGVQVGSNGSVIKKVLAKIFTIDPPRIGGEGVVLIDLSLPGASPGDSVFVSPIEADLWNTARWPFEFPATVSTNNNIALCVRNDWIAALDLAPFQIRIIVFGF